MRPSPAARRATLLAAFAAEFGRAPSVLVQAPGRVNLIGEHTDYNGLPVLPLAIDRQVWMAAAPRDDATVRLANLSSRFAPRTYALSATPEPFAAGDWGNYHQAAVVGLAGALGVGGLRGGDFLVDGDVPPGSGLSSSSALLVASALALLALAERRIEPLALAELAAAAERWVGTQSGGMDQAVCLLARAGHALRIDFDPLSAHPVPVPPGAALVVCHSLVEAEKSGAARDAYNQRVAECRLACRVLERLLGANLPRRLANLGDLARLYPDRAAADFAALLDNALPPRPVTIDEIARRVGISQFQLAANASGAAADATYTLAPRVRHVLSEAERVGQAEAALAAGDWARLAALMDASHASCRDDYEVSSPALEELVAAARESGALAARLTGAGFGGCTINLVAAPDLALFLTRIHRAFYQQRPAARGREHVFVVTPSPGAGVEIV
ncbi:MAG: galactokinase [Deltaproteobacteria bacterium]|nr:galactokinase [Deltaproteobacteria bacterium]